MMQRDLWGRTALDYSIDILREFEPLALASNPHGYVLAFSGGKDSIAVKRVADLAGVKYEAIFHPTTVDPPEVLRFIHRHYPDVSWDHPKKSMWTCVAEHGMLPTRIARFCCQELKEIVWPGRLLITGVRSAESARRNNRKMVEVCHHDPTTRFLHAIKLWTDQDVWDFIREQRLPYPCLYDEGFKRIGCVLCPFVRNTAIEVARWPHIAEGWRKAAGLAFAVRKQRGGAGTPFANGDDYYRWWLDRDASMPDTDENQCSMFGE
jgi:phosphoadenosine phosphosulfate reductase